MGESGWEPTESDVEINNVENSLLKLIFLLSLTFETFTGRYAGNALNMTGCRLKPKSLVVHIRVVSVTNVISIRFLLFCLVRFLEVDSSRLLLLDG